MRFWDSSALVPLAVRQEESATTEAWHREDSDVAMWTMTPVEAASALCRLGREGRFERRGVERAEARLEELWRSAFVIIDVEPVKATAIRLLRRHPLRAADSLQLGAALLWSEGDPRGCVFHSLDGRLAAAARAEGFRVP